MPNYRRPFAPGGTFFFTLVTAGRAPLFGHASARQILREAFAATAAELAFETVAIVLLLDHLHAMWTLPAGDTNFSRRWALIKGRFTLGY